MNTALLADNSARPQKANPGDDLGGNPPWVANASKAVFRDDGEQRRA